MQSPYYDQDSFRGRNDDGGESGATWIASTNTDFDRQEENDFRVRFLVMEENGVSDNNQSFQLQYNRNGSGWNNVTTSSSVAQAVSSSNYADGDATTQQIGTGTFTTGRMAEDGVAGDNTSIDFNGGDETEVEFKVDILATDVNHNDIIDFRVILGSGTLLDNYTNITSVTVKFIETVNGSVLALVANEPSITANVVGQAAWQTASDWDNFQSQSGTVHEAVTNTDHDDDTIVKRGYSVASPDLSSSMLLYCPLHEDSGSTVYDKSGNNLDGTNNGATVDVAAQLGVTAYSFDGSSSYLSFNDDGTLSNVGSTGDAFTYMLWFNQANSGDYQSVGQKSNDNDADDFPYNIQVDAGGANGATIDWTTQVSGSWNRLSASPSFNYKEWNHLAIVYNAGAREIFFNATSVASDTITDGDYSNTLDKWIGARATNTADSPKNFFNGKIWEPQLHNTNLSASQIQSHYDAVATDGTYVSGKKAL